eukprot:6184419-Pleurochrysis_carterae.AAC.2
MSAVSTVSTSALTSSDFYVPYPLLAVPPPPRVPKALPQAALMLLRQTQGPHLRSGRVPVCLALLKIWRPTDAVSP